MNIVILNGSPRKNGATASILNVISAQLSKYEDVHIEYYDLAAMKMAPCLGCLRCYKTGSCILYDDAEQLSKKMAEADGLVIGSPTYTCNLSVQLKTLIDRGHFVMEQALYGKYALSVATFENYGGGITSNLLNRWLSTSGAVLSGSLIEKLPFQSALSDKAIKRAEKYAVQLHQDILHRKPYRLQRLRNTLAFHVGIKPYVLRKGADCDGVVARWHEVGILNGK